MPRAAHADPTRGHGQQTTAAYAVVWLGRGRAIVVHGDAPDARAVELVIPGRAGALPAALAGVAREVGEVDRVLVLGDDDLRTAFEREIVAIGHRPDIIRDAVLEGPVDPATLLAELRQLG